MKAAYGIFVALALFLVASFASQPRQNNEKLEQWANARFGMFVHWGVYSGPAGVWHHKTCEGYYAEHLMRLFRIPLETYKKEVAASFNPTEFNADEWVRILKDAGMSYMVITAKHHDGFAMYDSAVSDYDIMDATSFGRDPMRELRDACKREGVLFGFYYSHAQDWSTPNGVRNDWDFDCPTERNWTKSSTNWYPNIKKYYDEKAIPQLLELVENYDPDIIWFDTAFWGPTEYNKLCVDAVLDAKPDLIINSRGAGEYRASYKSTNDKPVEFEHLDGYWEAIPSVNQSYGYHCRDHTQHPPSYLIQLIVKAAAKGGNMLLNIGPKGDGTISTTDQGVLAEIGKWMAVNGESVRGTEKSPLPTQSFGEVTRKGNTLYCHIFQWPYNGKLVVGGLASKVWKAYLLTDPETELATQRVNEMDLEVSVPTYPQERVDAVLVLECESIQTQGERLLVQNVEYNRLHVVDAILQGKGLKYAGGNWRTDHLKGWNASDMSAAWKIRLNESARFDLFISYDAAPESDGNCFEISVGDNNTLRGTVVPGLHRDNLYVGRVEFEKGNHEVIIRSQSLEKGSELMGLRCLKLVPVN